MQQVMFVPQAIARALQICFRHMIAFFSLSGVCAFFCVCMYAAIRALGGNFFVYVIFGVIATCALFLMLVQKVWALASDQSIMSQNSIPSVIQIQNGIALFLEFCFKIVLIPFFLYVVPVICFILAVAPNPLWLFGEQGFLMVYYVLTIGSIYFAMLAVVFFISFICGLFRILGDKSVENLNFRYTPLFFAQQYTHKLFAIGVLWLTPLIAIVIAHGSQMSSFVSTSQWNVHDMAAVFAFSYAFFMYVIFGILVVACAYRKIMHDDPKALWFNV